MIARTVRWRAGAGRTGTTTIGSTDLPISREEMDWNCMHVELAMQIKVRTPCGSRVLALPAVLVRPPGDRHAASSPRRGRAVPVGLFGWTGVRLSREVTG